MLQQLPPFGIAIGNSHKIIIIQQVRSRLSSVKHTWFIFNTHLKDHQLPHIIKYVNKWKLTHHSKITLPTLIPSCSSLILTVSLMFTFHILSSQTFTSYSHLQPCYTLNHLNTNNPIWHYQTSIFICSIVFDDFMLIQFGYSLYLLRRRNLYYTTKHQKLLFLHIERLQILASSLRFYKLHIQYSICSKSSNLIVVIIHIYQKAYHNT